jgi:integrase
VCSKPRNLGTARQHQWASEWLDSAAGVPSTILSHERRLGRLFIYIHETTGEPAASAVDFRRLLDIRVNGIFVGKGPIDTKFLSEFLVWHVQGIEDPDARARKRNDMIYTLRLFFRWCAQRRRLPQDPSRYLEVASVRRKINHRKCLNPEESAALLAAAAQSGRHAPRNVAMMATLLLSGLRPGELCALVPTRLDFESGWILANGKTGEGAAVMPPALAKVLRRYLASQYFRRRSKGSVTGGCKMSQ